MRHGVRVGAVLSALCLATAAACSPVQPDDDVSPGPTTPAPPPVHTAELRLPDEVATVLEASDPAERAAAASRTFFVSAPVAVLAPADDVAAQVRAAAVAVALGAPMLLTAPATAPPADAPQPESPSAEEPPAPDPAAVEIDRLGALAVITLGGADAAFDLDIPLFPAPADDDALATLLRRDLGPAEAPSPDAALTTVAALDRDAPTLPGATTTATAAPEDDADGASTSVGSDGSTSATVTSRAVPDAEESGTPAPSTDAPPIDVPELPLLELPEALTGALLLTTGTDDDVAAVATARAAGVEVLTVPGGDPRASSATVQALAQAQPEHVVGLGPDFGDAERLGWTTATAATGVELPGGGQILFPGRRLVAMYGTPGFPSLGILGEQDLPESITRAQQLAAEYQALTDDVVVPAFEIIATIASAGPGEDGNYSNELPAESFLPWIEAARDAGVYVLLDLQPGRTDFLTQARLYESLLVYPNVGLALDPEWRLKPDQVHLRQIGSVGIDEVNAVQDYLAELTRTHDLPQKLFVLHQFSLRMITDRDRLVTSHPELAVMIHADGQGSQPAKTGTWNALHNGAPEGIAWGWKNFIDEDVPMLTPEQTYQVSPAPQLVSYQ